jgi:hypothetical protein
MDARQWAVARELVFHQGDVQSVRQEPGIIGKHQSLIEYILQSAGQLHRQGLPVHPQHFFRESQSAANSPAQQSAGNIVG